MLRYATGIECGINPLTVGGGAATITADTTGPNGGTYALKIVSTSTAWSLAVPPWAAGSSADEVLLQIAAKKPSSTPSATAFLAIQVSSTNFVNIALNTDDTVQAYRSSTSGALTTSIGAASVTTWTNGVWHTIWVRVKPSTTTTGIVEIWMDGTRIVNLTSVVTCGNALDTSRGVTVLRYCNLNDTEWLDDVVVCDSTTGLGSAGVPEPLKIESAYVPTGDSSVQWTRSAGATNASCLDELPFSAADSVTSSTVGQRDVIDFADRAASPVIRGVVGWALAKNPDGGAGTFKLGIRSVSTEVQTATTSLTATDTMVNLITENDPNTGVAWTNSGLNAAKLTLEVV